MTLDMTEFDYVTPPQEHLEEVMQGAIDLVSGAESLTGQYTRAQKYLYSCLDSSDTISYKDRLGGMEGVFGAIGNGLKAAFEYVQNMFKSIWEFFFGSSESSGASKTEKVKKNVEENAEAVKDIANGTASEEVVNQTIAQVKTNANKVSNNPKASSSDKAKAAEIVERLDEVKDKPKAEKAKVVKEAAPAVAKISLTSAESIKVNHSKFYSIASGMENYIGPDVSDKIADEDLRKNYKELRKTFLEGFSKAGEDPNVKKAGNLTTLAEATAVHKALLSDLADMRNGTSYFKDEKAKIDKLMDEVKKAMSDSANDAAKKAANVHLNDLKIMGGLMNQLSKATMAMSACIDHLSDSINRHFSIQPKKWHKK